MFQQLDISMAMSCHFDISSGDINLCLLYVSSYHDKNYNSDRNLIMSTVLDSENDTVD